MLSVTPVWIVFGFICTAQTFMYVAEARQSFLWAQHRDLKCMPSTSRPMQALIRWGWIGWFCREARLPAILGLALCLAAEYVRLL